MGSKRKTKQTLEVITYGMAIVDYLFFIDKELETSALINTKKVILCLGGCATNTATHLSVLGIKTGLVSCHCLGRDDNSKFFFDKIKQYAHIETRYVVADKKEKTPYTIVLIDKNAQRTMITSPCPSKYISLHKDYLLSCKLLCLDGTYCLSDKVVEEAAELAYKNKIPVVVNDVQPTSPIWKTATIIINSIPNAEQFSIEKLKEQCRKQYPETRQNVLIVTLGAHGCFLMQKKRIRHFPVPVTNIEIVDTTGAGDAFRAGIIYSYLQNWKINKTLNYAMTLASQSCQNMGGVCKLQP